MAAQAAAAAVVDTGGVPVRIDGPADAAETVLLLHGWPDTLQLWDATVAALVAAGHRCLRFTHPGFEPGSALQPTSLDRLVEIQAQVVQQHNGGRPVTLLIHDWGCVFGYQFAMTRPELVARVIAVDIGDAGSGAHRRGLTIAQLAMVAGYQLWLVAAWRLARLGLRGPADAMTRAMARWARAPGAGRAHAGMNYPYDISWTGSHGGYRHAIRPEPKCPTLYVWGERKPFLFHSRRWLQALQQRPGCRALGLPCGHWVMVQQAKAFQRAAIAFIAETAPPALPRP